MPDITHTFIYMYMLIVHCILISIVSGDPVGDVSNFTTEPGLGLQCTLRGVESCAKGSESRIKSSAIVR